MNVNRLYRLSFYIKSNLKCEGWKCVGCNSTINKCGMKSSVLPSMLGCARKIIILCFKLYPTLTMLAEHFIASIGTPAKAPNASVTKDAGVFVYELQPLAGQRSFFKKSATKEQCLAVSETHIFAAQAEKAVINVYNREKGNQEATIPFNERITCIVLAAEESLLILGTESGRILLWEVMKLLLRAFLHKTYDSSYVRAV